MYTITQDTLYIRACSYSTLVKEVSEEYSFNGNVLSCILNNSCVYYGSSFKGRVQGSSSLLGGKYKLPIIINEKNCLIFFPLYIKMEVIWINFNMINNLEKVDNLIVINFKNGLKLDLNISYTIINNQLLKCSRLWWVYLSRK